MVACPLAGATISLRSVGDALADHAPQAQQVELAAGFGIGRPEIVDNFEFAAAGGLHPDTETDARATQLAATGDNHPLADTDRHGVQYALLRGVRNVG